MPSLDLGSGNNPQPGYIHMERFLDRVHPMMPDVIGDGFKLPFICESFDSVLMFGVFEHFGYFEVQEVLHEIIRVLKIGGSFKFDVPDFDWFIDAYQGKIKLDPVRTEAWIMQAFYGGQDGPGMYHRWGWNEKRMRDFLSKPNWNFSSFNLVGRQWRDPEPNHLIWECVK